MHKSTRRVEFGDTDMAGIMYFANFFRFMEVAETDFLHSLGLTVSWREGDQKCGFPRVSVACDFVRPARFEDVLTVAVGRITTVFSRSSSPDQLASAEIPADVRAKLEGFLPR